jgi:putative hydrolase of the HAD superfamily
VDSEEFLKRYFKEDALYRKKLKETLRESLLDDIVSNALRTCGYESASVVRTIGKAVDFGLATRRAKWFPNAKRTLVTLRKRGYELGLISNTHWRISESLRKEFEQFFDVTTLSYEHGYAKPHPSIFIATVDRLRVSPNQCLHVGDDPVADIQGAKNAGMKTAFIKRKRVRTDADIEIGRISELGKLL